MSAGWSMGKAFRPSRFGADAEPEQAEDSVERESRIRAYARRVRLRMPLFDTETLADVPPQALLGH
jgi:hypothetical protein